MRLIRVAGYVKYNSSAPNSSICFITQGKLVKLFSRQLVTKQKCTEDWNHCEKLRYYPKLEQWLQVVGINEEAIKVKSKIKYTVIYF